MSDKNTITKTTTEKPKSQEITFESFLELLKLKMALKESKAIPQVFLVVKKGFSGEFSKDQIDIVFNLLKTWKFVDFLAIKLINEEKSGKLRTFAKQLINRIRFNFIQEYKYPVPTNGASISRDEIFEWIKICFENVSVDSAEHFGSQTLISEKTTSSNHFDGLLRKMFVCLSNNSKDEFIFETIDFLLTQYLSKSGKKFKIFKNAYINLVNKALGTKNPVTPIEDLLMSSAPFKEIAVEARESENELWRKIQSFQAKIHQFENNELSLTNQIRETAQKNDELNIQLNDKTRALDEWKEENKELDNHWRKVNKEQLLKQANDIKNKIQHDIEGVRLSIENSTPDIEMALLLLKRIEKNLGEIVQNAK